jgi:acylglycerol lipase
MASLTTPWGEISEEEMYRLKGIKASQSFFKSPRGLNYFTRTWLPGDDRGPPRALICMLHGYGNDISWTFQNTAIHGRSDGLRAYVPDVDALVADCAAFFDSVWSNDTAQFRALPRFLYGESMGGAMCLLVHLRNPTGWDGAVMVAPMCRISDKVKPPWPVAKFLTFLATFVPTLAIVPTEDLIDKSVKVPSKRIVARSNPRRYTGKPRLGTVLELLRVTDYLGQRLQDVDLPFIVLHGDADVVTDPSVSRNLYEVAKSKDKTLKIYEGMLHSLLFGEPDENIAIVLGDICDWLTQRIDRKANKNNANAD